MANDAYNDLAESQLQIVRAHKNARAYTDASNISIRLDTLGTISPGVAALVFAGIKKSGAVTSRGHNA